MGVLDFGPIWIECLGVGRVNAQLDEEAREPRPPCSSRALSRESLFTKHDQHPQKARAEGRAIRRNVDI